MRQETGESEGSAWSWNPAKEQAAVMLAEDRLSDDEIARECRVARATLARWKKAPEFAGRLEEIRGAMRARVLKRGISQVENRVAALQDRHDRLRRIIEARAAHYACETEPDDCDEYGEGSRRRVPVPGADTGLLVKTYKNIGDERVAEYAVDTGLLREMREHEKQAAQELGQWLERTEVAGKDGGPVVVKVLRGVSLDDL